MKAQLLTRTALLVAITLAVHALGLPPQVRGPALNTMLLLATIFVGPVAGIILGALTPWIGLTWGFISPVFAPAIPFVIAGNVAYVLVFARLCRWAGRYIALFVGSLAKFAILAGAVNFLVRLPGPVAASLGVPELFTALLGGAVALVIAQLLAGIYGNPSLLIQGKRVENP